MAGFSQFNTLTKKSKLLWDIHGEIAEKEKGKYFTLNWKSDTLCQKDTGERSLCLIKQISSEEKSCGFGKHVSLFQKCHVIYIN